LINLNIKALGISIAVSVFFIVLGILSTDSGVVAMSIFLSIFFIAIPQFFLAYERFRTLKEMETKFPLFLRDMVESLRSGMPFHQSVIISSKVDYGKLSKEVKKMANQISWGLPFDKVIKQFAERVKGSRRLNIALKTIRESYIAGGDVVSALESVADTAVLLDESEKERKSLLHQYVVLMYGINFLFLGIIVAINRLMVPIFEVATQPGAEEAIPLTNPCNECLGFSCSVCDTFTLSCNMFGIKEIEKVTCYYSSLFFFMSMIVSICTGLIAGQISEGSVVAGLKHSLIMSGTTFGAFFLLVRLGLMGA